MYVATYVWYVIDVVFILQKHEIERLSAWHNPTANVDYNLPGKLYAHACSCIIDTYVHTYVCTYMMYILYSGFLSWIQTCAKLNYNDT